MKNNVLRKLVKEAFAPLNEATLSRIWQHIKSNRSFGVVSAALIGTDYEENEKRHNELEQDVRKMGYGYIEQLGVYTFKGEQNAYKTIKEKSLFIPRISLEKLRELGKKYEQETIIYKDDTRFDLINVLNGSTVESFQKEGQVLTFDKETLKKAYSQLLKSKNKNALKPFSFKVMEIRIPSMGDAISALKENKFAEITYISLF